ncbi:hypothetical protein [Sphingomonas soli]|uniref:hypothetical protein n=1 Tax=Sphingomonas soli TaxID=266127 RepID=UPI000831E0F8|nr:hypothetical protein [Sphingomonas soli]
MIARLAIAAATLILAGLATAATAPDPVMLNNPNPAGFQVYGVQPPPRTVVDEGVEGGRALPVTVSGKGEVWATGVNVPITKAVKAGDKITIYFWAKLQGATGSARIAAAQLQLAAAPYTKIFGDGVTITPQWKLYQVSGVADAAYPKGTLNAAFHLNTGSHTVVLGAVAVLQGG